MLIGVTSVGLWTRRFRRLGTNNLRIDYLRPGISDDLDLRGEFMPLGSRMASTRMEFLLGVDGNFLTTKAGA
ncbi:MAG: hypothetical protein DCF26_22365 [Burkholderiales bacterium]|nr:MAG: hypothetical protein DCF26_22365 [Burkholderiales bacterium]